MSARSQSIHLGYEVGTAKEVAIPLRHMAVTGMTQEAGKSTALEALISRAQARALAFITKRGEGSFTRAYDHLPYFHDGVEGRPYWQYVEDIIESTMKESKKFERSWIVKAARGSRSLQQVRDNIPGLMKEAKRAMDRDIFMLLAEYLNIVIPQIERVDNTDGIILQPGLTVMDLTRYSEEMQMLIVRSSIEWIHRHEQNVITIMPEAWKFLPEGKMTPVKPAAEKLIREGAGLGNFVWIDSQDIAGVSKLMLRAATVWLVGVQREANEVKRTLGNIPGTIKKPRATDIQLLEKGQFFACWGSNTVKTYVQPAWASDKEAQAVAFDPSKVNSLHPPRRIAPTVEHYSPILPLRDVSEQFRPEGFDHVGHTKKDCEEKFNNGPFFIPADQTTDKLEMKEYPVAEEPTFTISQLAAMLQSQGAKVNAVNPVPASGPAAPSPVAEDIYQYIKGRLMQEAPHLIKLLTESPEMVVSVERKVLEVDGKTLTGRVAKLVATNFFSIHRTATAVRTELKRTGPDVDTGNLSKSLKLLVRDGFLVDEADGYKAVPNMKTRIVEAK